ncbi:MAG: hypothetical protein K0Q52_128 [Microbacterium sp.]|jgi:hypothetical protein|nr:hypothetical protein [Microbacterium sp.]
MTDDERTIIQQILLQWKADGVQNPIIPAYQDEDGDGVPDFYGLDAADAVILVSGVTVGDTVAISTGEGIEGGSE